MKEGEENICLKLQCSECCNPVKVRKGFKEKQTGEFDKLPFKERKEIWIPESQPDTIKLEIYDCENYNQETELCKNYNDRPEICKNTKCEAWDAKDEESQKSIIKGIKGEEYIRCKK